MEAPPSLQEHPGRTPAWREAASLHGVHTLVVVWPKDW